MASRPEEMVAERELGGEVVGQRDLALEPVIAKRIEKTHAL